MSASEAELLAHCQHEITERAAIPRSVLLIEPMPLTAVGKIFKPALRLDAVQRCIRDTTAILDGAAEVKTEVRDVGGALVVVLRALNPSNPPALDNMRRALERYTFRVEVDETPLS